MKVLSDIILSDNQQTYHSRMLVLIKGQRVLGRWPSPISKNWSTVIWEKAGLQNFRKRSWPFAHATKLPPAHLQAPISFHATILSSFLKHWRCDSLLPWIYRILWERRILHKCAATTFIIGISSADLLTLPPRLFWIFARLSPFTTIVRVAPALFPSTHPPSFNLVSTFYPFSNFFTPHQQYLCQIRLTRLSRQDRCAARPFPCPACTNLCRGQWRGGVCGHRHSQRRRWFSRDISWP